MDNSHGISFIQPSHNTITAPGIPEGLKLTLDEFLLFDASLVVAKILSGEKYARSVTIQEACKSMRKKPKHREASCFTLSISADDELNEIIDMPNYVKEHSLFNTHWPYERVSKYFKKRNKLFHGFQEGYKSFPYSAYGGLSEWIYVISGTLDVTLYKPTKLNLLRHSTLSEDETFIPEEKSESYFKLKEGSLLTIPSSWISIRKAKRNTFALGGELLHYQDLITQMDALMRDVVTTNGRYFYERDSEIRAMYWFFAANLVPGSKTKDSKITKAIELSKFDTQTSDCLRKYLTEWKMKHKKSLSDKNACLPAGVYAPDGIRIDLILRDLNKSHTHLHTRRKSIKSEKNTVDVSMSQTSTEDKSD